MKRKKETPHHEHMQPIPLFGDTTQQTSDVEFIRSNLAAYPAQAKAFVALNGRALLPITGHFSMLDQNVLIINVGATICPGCKSKNTAKSSRSVISDIISQTALSITESAPTPDSFNELLGGILDGLHEAIHHLGIQSREEALKIVDNISRELAIGVAKCWQENNHQPMTH